MEKHHIEKLNKLLKVVDIVESTQKEAIKSETAELIKEIKGKFEYLVDKHFIDIDNKAENILSEAQNYVLSVSNEQKLLRTELDENSDKISNLQELINNIEMPVFDVETWEKNVLEKIPVYEIPNAEDIVTGINLLPIVEEHQIDASHIKNLPKLVSQIGGGRGVKAISNSNVKITEIAKSINFTGTAITSITTDNNGNVTVGITSGGSPLAGSPNAVGYFNALGNDLSSMSYYFEYDESLLLLNLRGEAFTPLGVLNMEILNGYTIFTNSNIIENYSTSYLMTDAPLIAGYPAGIGSWGTDGTNFYIKYGASDVDWGIPLLYDSITSTVDNPYSTGSDVDFITNVGAEHFTGKTSVPTISAGAGAGTTPIIAVTGNDFKHTVSIRTGTTPTAGAVIATVTFNKAWNESNNNPVFSAQDGNAALSITEVYMVRTSTTTYDIIDAGSGLKPSELYTWSVIVAE